MQVTTNSWTSFATDNNVLNENVNITYKSVPDKNPEQTITVKVTSGNSILLSETTLNIGNSTGFSIPWNGGEYDVQVKGSTKGSVTIKVSDK